jgi:predicted RNA-binding Zn ribbon-like protein
MRSGLRPMRIELPRRVGGNLALDLVNTVSWSGTAHELDHLQSVDAVLAWAQVAGIVSTKVRRRLASSLDERDKARLLDQIHALRSAIDATAEAILRGGRAPDSMETVVRIAQESLARSQLFPALSKRTDFVFDGGVEQVLGPVAWAAVDLFRSDTLHRLKRCPPADCGWLFLDMTKNSSRRWCNMATCGNRAKINAHRRKRTRM